LRVTSGASSAGRLKRTTRQADPSWVDSTRAVPSTWPCTMWPPRRSPTAAARSMLTRSPGRRSPSVVTSIEMPITSAVNQSSPWSTTVRHTPETAIESPWEASETASGARTVMRAASPVRSQASTSPSSSMMPVNMSAPFLLAAGGSRHDEQILAQLLDAHDPQPPRIRDRRDAQFADREPVAAEQRGREVDGVLVGEAGGDDGGGERRPALDVDAPHPAGVELGEHALQVAGARLEHAGRVAAQGGVGGDGPLAHHDGQRLVREQLTGVAAGRQGGVVGEDRAGSDEDHVGCRPLFVHPLAGRGAGDPLARAVGGGGAAVEGGGPLDGHP